MLNVSTKSLEIADRFFKAIDTLILQNRLRGLQTFTRNHNLNQGNMTTLKNNRTKRGVKPEYLAFLAEDYGVSCEWLLLGTGEMFKPTHSKTEESPGP